MATKAFVTRDGREIAVNAVCDEGQFAGYVFGLGGPFVQYIDVTRPQIHRSHLAKEQVCS